MDMLNGLTTELATFNQTRLRPGTATPWEHPAERDYVEMIRRSSEANNLPATVDLAWFERLTEIGPGQGDPLFPFLAEQCTYTQMEWFLRQEAAGEAGFDDLVALTQVKMPTRVKLEMARNYWDEMGRGEERGMHGRLLEGVLTYMGVKPAVEATVPEALRLSNLMTALACNRCYAWEALGALGVIEMTAPGRVTQVDAGLKRLGVPKGARAYFTLHGALDVVHSRAWNAEVLEPLTDATFRRACEGAWMRLWCGQQCFHRYRREFGLGATAVLA